MLLPNKLQGMRHDGQETQAWKDPRPCSLLSSTLSEGGVTWQSERIDATGTTQTPLPLPSLCTAIGQN